MGLALQLERGAEAQRGDANEEPRELIRHADEVLQPGPQLAGTDEGGAKAEAANETSREDGDPGDLVPVELAEEAWGVAVNGQGVHETRSCE